MIGSLLLFFCNRSMRSSFLAVLLVIVDDVDVDFDCVVDDSDDVGPNDAKGTIGTNGINEDGSPLLKAQDLSRDSFIVLMKVVILAPQLLLLHVIAAVVVLVVILARRNMKNLKRVFL
mmetsp:Transcript_24019/g.35727  ORF Transcript_24019/g.35727 Transcript_24019/m.35727 type:complete len:118 (+) Transcript_24019:981-1334(+)